MLNCSDSIGGSACHVRMHRCHQSCAGAGEDCTRSNRNSHKRTCSDAHRHTGFRPHGDSFGRIGYPRRDRLDANRNSCDANGYPLRNVDGSPNRYTG